jgi:hypothetical protein
LRIVELGGSALDRWGQLVEAASTIYCKRLEREPALAELMLQNGRLRDCGRSKRVVIGGRLPAAITDV